MTTTIVGATVHFWSGGECRPAKILDIYAAIPPMPGQCLLRVPAADDAEVICEHDEAKTENTWHRPENQPNG